MILKKMVMGNYDKKANDPDIADSMDFMVEKVSSKVVWKLVRFSFLI